MDEQTEEDLIIRIEVNDQVSVYSLEITQNYDQIEMDKWNKSRCTSSENVAWPWSL